MSILETSYQLLDNVINIASRPGNWARDIAGGRTWLANDPPPRYEWTQAVAPSEQYDREAIGVSGTAILVGNNGISPTDVPFLHPFGFDYEFNIAPDPQFNPLLAQGNTAPTSTDYSSTKTYASEQLGLAVPGTLGVETDQDLVPAAYRVQTGDRVVVFGRWIVDCGHDDFHTEIHPPLLHVCARPSPADPTQQTEVYVVGRPYLIGQEFGDGALREHLIKEVAKVEGIIFIPLSLRVEAHPQIMPKPFDGLHSFDFIVRPPSPRQASSDMLQVSFDFTTRKGVTVEAYPVDSDAVRVVVTMNSSDYTPPHLPKKHDWSVSRDELQKSTDAYEWAFWLSVVFNPVAAAIIDRGILTDRYDAPQAPDVQPSEYSFLNIPVSDLPNPLPVSVDDSQPFPIIGWLKVLWVASPAKRAIPSWLSVLL